MKRILLLVALAALALPSPAGAKTFKCVAGEYGYYEEGFPNVSKLRAINLPRRTDGVASPCEVADAITLEIQEGFANDSKMPSTVYPGRGEGTEFDAWEGGPWICVDKQHWPKHLPNPYVVVKCHAKGKSHRKVTMELNE